MLNSPSAKFFSHQHQALPGCFLCLCYGELLFLLDIEVKDDNIVLVFLFLYIEVQICLGFIFNSFFIVAYFLPYGTRDIHTSNTVLALVL